MFLYGAAVLVLLINENAAKTIHSTPMAAADRPEDKRAPFDKGELAKLIHDVVEESDESEENEADDRRVTKLLGVAAPLDFNYFDILNSALKSGNKEIVNLDNKNLGANVAHAANPGNSDHAVRIHLINNPEVLEQYKKLLRKKEASTSSSSDYDDSLEYDRKVDNFIRRNAVFRLGRPSDKTSMHENQKLALRNNEDKEPKKHNENSREHDRVTHFEQNIDDFKDKIQVSFKDIKHEDSNDKPRHNGANKLTGNKNYYNDEEPAKKDNWDDSIKNDNYKKIDDEYKHKSGYDNNKKDKYDDYGDWNNKASKAKQVKSNDWDKKTDWEKPKKDNSWDNWKSKSMEQKDKYKRGNSGSKPKRTDDWDKPKKNNDWDKPKKSNEWDKPKKSDEWDKPKDNFNWDKPKKATKGLASFERDSKKDYNDKVDFKKGNGKKTTNEWDRVIAKSESGSGTAKKKPFVPVISDYYNVKPRMQQNRGGDGFKAFGRTSIPFVGKKGIYEDK